MDLDDEELFGVFEDGNGATGATKESNQKEPIR